MLSKITQPIKLLNRVELRTKEFINEAITKDIVLPITCTECSSVINIQFNAYTQGFPFASLYQNNFINTDVVLDNCLAQKANSWATHFGSYLVDNLPTLYFSTSCSCCNKLLLVVFGFGEQQPGKWVCKVSGVWNYQFI